jgi:hypothetical protein
MAEEALAQSLAHPCPCIPSRYTRRPSPLGAAAGTGDRSLCHVVVWFRKIALTPRATTASCVSLAISVISTRDEHLPASYRGLQSGRY